MMSAFRLSFVLAGVLIGFLAEANLSSHVHQIDHGHDEHPHQVHEVPVQGSDFNIISVVAAALVAQGDHGEGNDSTQHVGQVKAGYREESGSEHRGTPRVLEELDAFLDQPGPFANVKESEQNTA